MNHFSDHFLHLYDCREYGGKCTRRNITCKQCFNKKQKDSQITRKAYSFSRKIKQTGSLCHLKAFLIQNNHCVIIKFLKIARYAQNSRFLEIFLGADGALIIIIGSSQRSNLILKIRVHTYLHKLCQKTGHHGNDNYDCQNRLNSKNPYSHKQHIGQEKCHHHDK